MCAPAAFSVPKQRTFARSLNIAFAVNQALIFRKGLISLSRDRNGLGICKSLPQLCFWISANREEV